MISSESVAVRESVQRVWRWPAAGLAIFIVFQSTCEDPALEWKSTYMSEIRRVKVLGLPCPCTWRSRRLAIAKITMKPTQT
ncbi:hypothetical protein BDU57DRAFT_510291 [Ampelomyces quisqualis]|uniref:Uncharacterized protein n=1 Tax=Ampelomyces quisqualis TaxID=50730 RepID=A0A6A5R091_AMPQU|nr:hypothetical protein BDU57DRAFT_510291 [Ampelomyces quisqualis]